MADKKTEVTEIAKDVVKEVKQPSLTKGHINRKLKAMNGKDGAIFERNANRVIANNR